MLARRRRRRRPPMGQVSSSCLGQPISCHCTLPQYQSDSLGGGGEGGVARQWPWLRLGEGADLAQRARRRVNHKAAPFYLVSVLLLLSTACAAAMKCAILACLLLAAGEERVGSLRLNPPLAFAIIHVGSLLLCVAACCV